MKRNQRKANFKKIQNAQRNSSEENTNHERRQTRSSKTSNAAAGLPAIENVDFNNEPQVSKKTTTTAAVSPFAKRVHLTNFLYKDKSNIPAKILKRETDSSDDFETPVKKIKTAPKLSQRAVQTLTAAEAKKPNTKTKRKPSKQPNIKSALLRNEQMFSEIAAQHCIVDNFSPDDIQMALVISRSEVDTCNVDVDFAEGHGVNAASGIQNGIVKCAKSVDEDIHKKLQKYGFRTAARGDYANCFATAFSKAQRRGKTKWANKFTALTLRDADLQAKKLNQKIEAVMTQQYSFHKLKNDASFKVEHFKPYKVHSNFLLQHFEQLPDAQLFRNIEHSTINEHLPQFFIEELFPVTHLPAGHLLKDWKIIPGRDISPQGRKRKQLSQQEKKFENFYKELERESLLNKSVEHVVAATTTPTTAAAVDVAVDGNVNPTENVSMLVEPASQSYGRDSENDELDGLLEIIAQTTNDELSHKSNEMNLALEVKTNTIHSPIEIISSGDTNDNFEKCTTVTNTQTRCASPDIFADDSESDWGEENNLNNITTFEKFSSDEVKTSLNPVNKRKESLSMKAHDILDLTQNIADEENNVFETSCAKAKNSTLFEKESKCDFDEFLDHSPPKSCDRQNEAVIFKTLGIENNDLQIEDKVHNEYIPTDAAVLSIDLTQSDDELSKANDSEANDDDSDCILLSDDEINYSILKANEVNEHKTRRSSDEYFGGVNKSSSSSEEKLSPAKENAHNFSVLEFVKDASFFAVDQNDTFCRKQSFDFNLSGDAEPIKANYLSMAMANEDEVEEDTNMLEAKNTAATPTTTPKKTAESFKLLQQNVSLEIDVVTCNPNDDEIFSTPACYMTPTKDSTNISALLKAQRAEFGILESQSEPFSQTPPHWQRTPLKSDYKTDEPSKSNESPLCEAKEDIELQPPPPPPNAAAKRTSDKFNSFLQISNDLGVQPLSACEDVDFDDDFDEFDRLVYGSPPQKQSTKNTNTYAAQGVPSGLSQLLTGEISFNAPFTLNDSSPPSAKSSNKSCEMKTPEKYEEMTIHERVYIVRTTTSAKPNFETLSEAEILKQLYEYGIKPLKRKQAIKLLEYIYNETHPIIEPTKSSNSAMELLALSLSPQKHTPPNKLTTFTLSPNKAAVISESQGQSNVCKSLKFNTQTTTTSTSTSTTVSSVKFKFQDCYGDILLRFSQELFAELRNDDEIYIFQTNVTKKTQQPLLPLHIAWFNLVCSSQELHESILMYEPIDLQEVYLFFKSLGYRYDPKDLKSFLDCRCIIFRYDLTAPEKQTNRHTRKPKKKMKKQS